MAAVTGSMDCANTTQADGHRYMVTIRQYLLDVGLTQLTLDDGYDATASGSETQIPTVNNEFSKWMAFAFSDAHQSVHPITIRVRVGKRQMGNSSNYDYLPQLSVSSGVDASGATHGAIVSSSSGNSYTSGSAYEFNPRSTNSGDFVRYSGDALTFVLGARGLYRDYENIYRSVLFLHIERPRNPEGAVIGGHNTMVFNYGFNDRYATDGVQSHVNCYRPVSETEAATSTHSYARAGDSLGYMDNSAYVLAPIYVKHFLYDRITALRKAFTIPTQAKGGAHVTTPLLNFSGEERRYLILSHQAIGGYPGSRNLDLVFEWE